MAIKSLAIAASALFGLSGLLNAKEPPRSMPTAGASDKRLSLEIFGGSKRVPLPYEVQNDHLFFRAALGGRVVWMLLDNGAAHDLIDKNLASQLGLAVQPGARSLATSDGSIAWGVAKAVPLSIDGQLRATWPFAVVDMTAASRVLGRPIGGVLGNDMLQHVGLVADVTRRTLQLVSPGALKPPPSIVEIPLIGRAPQVTANIGGHTLRLTLDLGSNDNISLTPDAWNEVKGGTAPVRSGVAYGAAGKAISVSTATLPTVKLGSLLLTGVPVTIRPWPPTKGDGVIGLKLLVTRNFALDLGAQKLWVSRR